MARSLNSRNLDAIAKQLLDKKIRRSNQDHRTDTNDAEMRIFQISAAFEKNPELHEIRRHSIVAVVAALQTYHRGFLADVMDHDPGSRIRGANLVGEKFPLSEILRIIGGEEISVSDIIAHAAPVNSVEDMIAWLSGVFGEDFQCLLRDSKSPHDRNDAEDAPILIDDIDKLIGDVSKAFQIRHILAHEAALDIELEEKLVSSIIESARLWITASHGVLWQTVLRNEPYTQYEMNETASLDHQTAHDRLEAALKRVRALLGKKRNEKFEKNQEKWLLNTLEFCEMIYGAEQGTMWPAVRASELSRSFDERSKQLEDWAFYLEF